MTKSFLCSCATKLVRQSFNLSLDRRTRCTHTLDAMAPPPDTDTAPFDHDRGMMALLLGNLADLVCKGLCGDKVAEPVRSTEGIWIGFLGRLERLRLWGEGPSRFQRREELLDLGGRQSRKRAGAGLTLGLAECRHGTQTHETAQHGCREGTSSEPRNAKRTCGGNGFARVTFASLTQPLGTRSGSSHPSHLQKPWLAGWLAGWLACNTPGLLHCRSA